MLSDVPEEWSELSFGELTSIVGGITPKKNVEEYWDSEDILWATPTDITSLPEGSHFLHDTATKASISAAERGGLKLLPADTVLMTSRATIGYVAIAKSEMSTNQGFANFLPSDKFIPLFLLYLLHSKRDQFINNAGGSTFKEISKGTLKSLTTLLPPLNEQHRITEVLSSVDASIQATQAVIDQAERVKEGLLEELLTGGLGSAAIEQGEVPERWVSKKLGDVCAVNMGQSPKSSDVNAERQGMPFLQGCAEFGNYAPTPKAWIREPLKVAQAGDILFSVRAPVGKMNIAPVQLSIGRGLCAINSKSTEQQFLRYLLAYITPQICAQSQGSTFQAVNKKQIKEALVSLPPFNEQIRIAGILASVDDFIANHRATIEQQSCIKQGLMNDLLTGKVRTV